MTTIPVLGEQVAGPWFRVLSVVAPSAPGSAEQDFLAILPAAASAARGRRPFVAGWLCRAAGSPLEFITNAVLAGPDHPGHTGQDALLFPAGAVACRRPPTGSPRATN